MSNDVKIKLSLTENVSSQLKGVSKQFDKLGGPGSGASLFGNIGAKAVAKGFDLISMAAGSAVDFLKTSVDQARQGEVSQALLAQALYNNAKAWDGNTQAIEDRIEAGFRLGFADDDQRDSLTKLITVTGDVEKSFDVLALAMDVARYKNISLGDASMLLIKAMGGSKRALKELGITMAANVTSGDILSAIMTKLDGIAEKYAETLNGKMDAANAKLQNAQEELGKYITPALTFAITGLANIFDYISGKPTAKATGALKTISDAVEFLGDRVLELVGFIQELVKGFQDVAVAAFSAANAINPFGGPDKAKGSFTGHAAGGWVGLNGPEFGILGEGGKPEYISDRPQSGGSSGGVTIQGVSEQEIMRMVDRGLYVKLQRAGTAR